MHFYVTMWRAIAGYGHDARLANAASRNSSLGMRGAIFRAKKMRYFWGKNSCVRYIQHPGEILALKWVLGPYVIKNPPEMENFQPGA